MRLTREQIVDLYYTFQVESDLTEVEIKIDKRGTLKLHRPEEKLVPLSMRKKTKSIEPVTPIESSSWEGEND